MSFKLARSLLSCIVRSLFCILEVEVEMENEKKKLSAKEVGEAISAIGCAIPLIIILFLWFSCWGGCK